MRIDRNLAIWPRILLFMPWIALIVIAGSFPLAIVQETRSTTVHASVTSEYDRNQLTELAGARTLSHLYLAATSKKNTSQQAASSQGNDIFHVAIFRFNKDHLNDAMAAFHALASATRQESGSLSYNIYRGIDDDQEFYVVEHWASPAALAAHERTDAFIHYGQGVLVKYATLHDTVTSRAFDVR